MVKGIIFDMDGTLTWTDALHHQAYNKVLKPYGIQFSFEEYIERFGGRGALNFFNLISEEYNLNYDIYEVAQKKSKYFNELLNIQPLKTIQGVEEVLENALSHKVKLIVASGASRESIQKILFNAKLLHYFPDFISVNEVSRSKPFPDVFIEALKRLNLEAADCVVFEDSFNGVKAAKAAGLKCIALETTTKRDLLKEAGADIIVKDYTQLNKQLLFN